MSSRRATVRPVDSPFTDAPQIATNKGDNSFRGNTSITLQKDTTLESESPRPDITIAFLPFIADKTVQPGGVDAILHVVVGLIIK